MSEHLYFHNDDGGAHDIYRNVWDWRRDDYPAPETWILGNWCLHCCDCHMGNCTGNRQLQKVSAAVPLCSGGTAFFCKEKIISNISRTVLFTNASKYYIIAPKKERCYFYARICTLTCPQ